MALVKAKTLPYGTLISRYWDEEWIEKVRQAEAEREAAICGSRRRNDETRSGQENKPCRNFAGAQTDHPGEGRCKYHGGNRPIKTGKYSPLRHHQLKAKMEELADNPDLMNIRSAVATTWAVIDTMLEEDAVITRDRAQDIVAAMTRISTMIKQHHDITEGHKIMIEVPQFMEWAEHLYELAIKHILAKEGNVSAFLAEAQQYYTHAVGVVVGGGNRPPAIGNGSVIEIEGVLRPGEPVPGSAEGAD